jgi:hypothetical protein
MGQAKNYLLNVICACSEHEFGQDAIEYAICMGYVKLTYSLATDVQTIMARYDEIIETYQRESIRNNAALLMSYEPLLGAIASSELDTPEGRRKDRILFGDNHTV